MPILLLPKNNWLTVAKRLFISTWFPITKNSEKIFCSAVEIHTTPCCNPGGHHANCFAYSDRSVLLAASSLRK